MLSLRDVQCDWVCVTRGVAKRMKFVKLLCHSFTLVRVRVRNKEQGPVDPGALRVSWIDVSLRSHCDAGIGRALGPRCSPSHRLH